MKYNIPLIVQENDSLSMLLKYIHKNSRVLEFGCANGRMTRYMKEELGCSVSIIEYEEAAFNDAIHYAVDGYNGDIMAFEWLEKFKGQKYDYIIFADVLEHLYDPWKVLSSTKKLLEDGGSVLLSIPNIAHNDIVSQLYMHNFNYTPTGLLDDTHIRFFTESTVESLCQNSGYSIVEKECTTVDTTKTEQYVDISKMTMLERSLIYSRKNGTIFQFILRLKESTKGDLEVKPYDLDTRLAGRIYLDEGEGFSEKKFIDVFSTLQENGCFLLDYKFNEDKTLRKFRFDPVEGIKCIILEAYFLSGEERHELYSAIPEYNGVKVMDTLDPFLECDNGEIRNGDRIYCRFIIPGERFINDILKLYDTALREISLEQGHTQRLSEQLLDMKTRYEAIREANEIFVQNHQMLQGINTELLKTKENLEQEIYALKSENGEVRHLNTELLKTKENLEKEIYALQAENGEVQHLNGELHKTKENLEKEIYALQAENGEVQHLNGELHKTKENLEKEIYALQAENGELHKTKANLEQEMAVLKTNNISIVESSEKLQEEKKELEDEVERLKSIISEMKKTFAWKASTYIKGIRDNFS